MEKSSFFNSVTHDRKYKAEDWAEYFSTFISNGVFPAPKVGLGVTAGGNMKVLLDKGQAFLNGYRYQNTEPLELELPIPDGALARICRVVIRWNLTARNIQAAVKSSPLALTPAAPALQRDAEAFELCVAEILIPAGSTAVQAANITDTRFDDALCGIVGWMVEDVDTTGLFEQFKAAFRARKSEMEREYQDWLDELEATLDEDAAGHIMNLLNEYRAKTFIVDVPASGWKQFYDIKTAQGYTRSVDEINQRIEVPGLTAAMCELRPEVDIVLSAALDGIPALEVEGYLNLRRAELEAWAYVEDVQCEAGAVRLIAPDRFPKTDFKMVIKVVR